MPKPDEIDEREKALSSLKMIFLMEEANEELKELDVLFQRCRQIKDLDISRRFLDDTQKIMDRHKELLQLIKEKESTPETFQKAYRLLQETREALESGKELVRWYILTNGFASKHCS